MHHWTDSMGITFTISSLDTTWGLKVTVLRPFYIHSMISSFPFFNPLLV